jgi:hypothetical protein
VRVAERFTEHGTVVSGRLREYKQRLGVDQCLVLPLTHGRVERPLNDEAASFLADDGRMCRLFGLHAGGAAVAATFWLLDAPVSLAAQSHRNPDGAGIGVFADAGAPTVDSCCPWWLGLRSHQHRIPPVKIIETETRPKP